jgi:hypothetical protein
MDTKTVGPALTPEQWGDLSYDKYGERSTYSTPDGSVAHAAMATANACLPSGHPGKITREDVNDLLSFAESGVCDGMSNCSRDPDAAAALRALAAKLAALLPPE